MVQAGSRIKHHVARRQLDAVDAVAVLHRQFATAIIIGIAEEERCRQIAADAELRPFQHADGIGDMGGEPLADLIAVEERRKDMERERGGEERSEKGRVGKGWVITGKFWWWPLH